MKHGGPLALMLVALLLAGCREARFERHDTAVLGGQGQPATPQPQPQSLADAQGRAIPAPPAPARARVQAVRSSGEAALAAWVADGQVQASSWTSAGGWAAPQPLERIYGQSSDIQLASNSAGQAMAVWHHQVGNIHSLRFSRWDTNGWSVPDVLPGALPRPAVTGMRPGQNAPQLQMDAQGAVLARWPSGFHASEDQVARYSPGEGWSRAASAPQPPAPNASSPPHAPSSAP